MGGATDDTSGDEASNVARDGKLDAREFRRRLDEVLRRRQPEAVRDFLLASGQWQPDRVPADLERAMWLMIAGSPALAELHGEAERWLVSHGSGQEAQTILGRTGGGGGGPRGTSNRPPSGRPAPRGGARGGDQRRGPRSGPPPRTPGPTQPSPSGKPQGAGGRSETTRGPADEDRRPRQGDRGPAPRQSNRSQHEPDKSPL